MTHEVDTVNARFIEAFPKYSSYVTRSPIQFQNYHKGL